MNTVYKFSEFVLDGKSGTLFYKNDYIPISSRACGILLYLIERRGEIVGKEEILDKVWSDSFVEEANLAVHISALRRVLQEKRGESRYIRTISGRGYSFVAEVGEIQIDREALNIASRNDPHESAPSIAVLPFLFDNGSEDNEYLANGVTQSLIADLSNNENLHVFAFNAVKPYKHSERDLQEIGFLLNADMILTGNISEFKEKWEISAELVNISDKRCLWASTQTFEERDIFLVKRQISTAISEKLELKFKETPQAIGEINIEAQKLYYRGKFILESRLARKNTLNVLNQALKFFNDAVKRDPKYALAYVGMGSVYVSLFNHNLLECEKAVSLTKEVLHRALLSNDKLSEIYVLKASLNIMIGHDLNEAEKDLNTALELNRNNPDAYNWKSHIYLQRREFERAVELIEKAITLDPGSLRYMDNLSRIFFFSGNYNKAIILADEILEVSEQIISAYLFKAMSYAHLGFFEKAVEFINKVLEIRESSEMWLIKAYIYTYFDMPNEAREILEQVLSRKEPLDYTDVALVYAGLNMIEESLDCLEKAYREGGANLRLIGMDVRFNKLRGHPRFDKILEQLNLKRSSSFI